MAANPDSNEAEQPRYFYLRGSLWRLCLYGILFSVIATPMFQWVVFVADLPIGAFYYTYSGIFAFPGLWLPQFLFPRYRLNKDGIAQRFFLPVWNLWSWEKFASQELIFESNTFYTEKQSIWLSLELDKHDFEEVMSSVSKVFRVAPDEPFPDLIIFKSDRVFRKTIEMSESGVLVKSRSGNSNYSWSEIKGLERWISHEKQNGYNRLILITPERRIALREQITKLRPSTLFRYLQSKRIAFVDVDSRRRPQSQPEYQAMLEFAKLQWSQAIVVRIGFPSLLLLLIAAAFFLENEQAQDLDAKFFVFIAGMLVFFDTWIFLITWWQKRQFRKYAQELGLSAEEAL